MPKSPGRARCQLQQDNALIVELFEDRRVLDLMIFREQRDLRDNLRGLGSSSTNGTNGAFERLSHQRRGGFTWSAH